MAKPKYKILNEFGGFVPFNDLTFKGSISYTINQNDFYDDNQMKTMGSSSIKSSSRAAGAAQLGAEFNFASALWNIKTYLARHTPTKPGTYLFVAELKKNKVEDKYIGLQSISLVRTHSPESTAKTMQRCNSGQISCVHNAPVNNTTYHFTISIIAIVR